MLDLPPAQSATRAARTPARRSYRRRLFAGAAVTAVALAVLAVVLLSGGKSSDGPVPDFSVQITPAARWAVSQYPGSRPLDKGVHQRDPTGLLSVVTCGNGDTFSPGSGVPVGGTITCDFLTRDQHTTVDEKVHVLSNHPIKFAPITARDCFEGTDQYHKTGPCR
jgi:hypothetical protein